MGPVIALVCLAGCSFQVSSEGAGDIYCTRDAHCPPGFRCKTEAERCLDAKLSDGIAPVITELTLSPDVANAEDTFTLRFSVDGPLAWDPVAWVETGAERLDFTLDPARSDPAQQSYLFVLDAAAATREGAFPVLITAVDASGDELTAFRGPVLTLDFTAPQIFAGSVVQQLFPGPDNPLAEVTYATNGTVVRLAFSVSEPLVDVPELSTAPTALNWELVEAGTTTFVFEAWIENLPAQEQRYFVEATLTDPAGNASTAPLIPTGLQVDTMPPPLPDVLTPEQIVFTRIPWGSDDTGSRPQLRVRAAASAVEGESTLLVLASESLASELARGQVGSDGWFSIVMAESPDRSRIFVAAVDRAGNASEVVRVHNTEWIATLGGKILGSSVENPHTLELRPMHTASRVQLAGAEADGYSGLDRRNSGSPLRVRGAGRWISKPDPPLPPQQNMRPVYDSVRGRVVMFGNGASGSGTGPETWDWDGERWSPQPSQDSEGDGDPVGRELAAVAYDSARGVVLLYGGLITFPPQVFDDTWSWNGRGWLRVDNNSLEGPGLRAEAAMAYDSWRGRAVLFGGRGDSVFSGMLGDTWEWDGERWQPVCAEGAACANGLTARRGSVMAFDEARGRTVLFGGFVGAGSNAVRNDTWEWDGSSWQLVCAEDDTCPNRPALRGTSGMAAVSDGILVHGGPMGSNYDTGEIWKWDGSSWLLLCGSDDPDNPDNPCAEGGYVWRTKAGLAYDAAHDTLVVVGGQAGSLRGDTTWLWDARGWRLIESSFDAEGPPDGRMRHALAFDPLTDPARPGIGMLGGHRYISVMPTNDHWLWHGGSWRKICDPSLPCEAPVQRNGAAMLYRPDDDTLLVIGGSPSEAEMVPEDDTWVRAADGWTLMCNTDDGDECPNVRSPQAALDLKTGNVLLWEGGMSPTAWEWAGSQWQSICDTTACPESVLESPRIVYHEESGGVLLFGWDSECVMAMHVWDGIRRQWSELTASAAGTSPPCRRNHAVVEDPQRGRILMHGGVAGTQVLADTWLWDGTTWEQAAVVDPEGDGNPSARHLHAIAYDPLRDRALLFGGGSSAASSIDGGQSDTWEWDGGTARRPSVLFSARLPLALVTGEAQLQSVEIDAVAGGTGELDGVTTPGAEVALWSHGRWSVQGSNTAAASEPASLKAEGITRETAPQLLRGLLHGRAKTLHVALMPRGTNGVTTAEVAVDYVEVRVRYSTP